MSIFLTYGHNTKTVTSFNPFQNFFTIVKPPRACELKLWLQKDTIALRDEKENFAKKSVQCN